MAITTHLMTSRADYPELRRVCVDGDRLPADYDAFVTQVDEVMGRIQDDGKIVVKVNIKPAELAQWCAEKERVADADARGAYAALQYLCTRLSKT